LIIWNLKKCKLITLKHNRSLILNSNLKNLSIFQIALYHRLFGELDELVLVPIVQLLWIPPHKGGFFMVRYLLIWKTWLNEYWGKNYLKV
jgi:hypothetical protein